MANSKLHSQTNNSNVNNELSTELSRLKVDVNENFRSIPIAPDKNELLRMREIVLRPIRVKGKYPSVDDYLELHFHLMREDFIGPLRNGIKSLKEEHPEFSTSISNLTTSRDVFLYPEARFEITKCSHEGTSYIISFDKSGMTNFDWENSKRLIYGSFVCFLAEDYDISHFGIAVDRSKVADGKVAVQLSKKISNEKIIGKTFLMIEPRSYYNAYFHVLQRLKSLTKYNFPLTLNFIKCTPSYEAPAYLQRNPDLIFDISCVSLGRNLFVSPSSCATWPSNDTTLDCRQLQAFRHALTRKLALIQGPPGTGKTYIGLKICEVLVKSVVRRIAGFGPLLIVCYTNHALDQFLEGVICFLFNRVLRVGNQSSSSKLRGYLMSDCRSFYRRNYLLPYHLQLQEEELYDETLGLKSQISSLSDNLKSRNDAIVKLSFLKSFMKLHHIKNLPSQVDLEAWLCPVLEENVAMDNEEKSRRMLEELSSCDQMSIEKENEVTDLWKLSFSDRWSLYRLWRQKFIVWGYPHLDSLCRRYDKACANFGDLRMELDLAIFRQQYVIAMTTSCASRYGNVLDRLRPKIVLVEEAAEVLESHIICSLTSGCEQLILIGDHQQLRPNPAMHELKTKYHLDLSLFERLINNKFPYDTLQEQRRMRSEISGLMRYIYPDLKDHPIVNKCANVLGITTNTFFINHTEPETRVSQTKSIKNPFEANYTTSLVEYLVLQGYEPSQITIITPYSAQVILLKELVRFPDMRITTIDNYQGEENDIIVLSLVRSNEDNIGFSGDVNRVCVAMSRGRRGMYVLGNFGLFARKNILWFAMVRQMIRRKRLGSKLSIQCELHSSDGIVEISGPDDFKVFAPDGGCQRECKSILRCGHQCSHYCHPVDQKHHFVRCTEPCPRYCDRNLHRCPGVCGDECDPCMVEITTTVPFTDCKVTLPCYDDPSLWDITDLLQFQKDSRKAMKADIKPKL